MIYNLWKAGTDHQELKLLNPTKFYKFLLIKRKVQSNENLTIYLILNVTVKHSKEGTVQWKFNDLPYFKSNIQSK